MGWGSITARSHVDLTRVGLGVGDEVESRLRWDRRIHQHHKRRARDARDRRNVLDEIESELLIKCGVDRVTSTYQEECVAVCGGVYDCLGADIAARTWAIFNDEWLAEVLR
jgi:hypothetical protein